MPAQASVRISLGRSAPICRIAAPKGVSADYGNAREDPR